MLFGQGKLEKLTLRAFKPSANPNAPPQPSDKPEDTYTVQVNPTTYTLNRLLNYTYESGQGFSAGEAVYAGTAPVELNFEFLFDGTGVIPAPSKLGDVPLVGAIASKLSPPKAFVVMDEIKKFSALVDYHGEVHRPRPLLLVWGSLVFSCVVTALNFRFTLFHADGTPLRAIAACTFRETMTDEERTRKENATSPDLTHLRDVQEGDTLPALAYDIYVDPKFYLEVARVNQVVDFRRLRPGRRLSFPPVRGEEQA